MEEGDGRMNRRKVLATGVSIACGLSIGTNGVVSRAESDINKKKFKKTIQSSLVYREATQSRKKWEDYLEKHDISIHSNSYSFNKQNSGDGSGGKFTRTQELSGQSDLDITMGLAEDKNKNYYADLEWSYDAAEWGGDSGEKPRDGVGILYDKNWWNLLYDSISKTTETTSKQQYVEYEDGSYDGNGPGFTVDDFDMERDNDMQGGPYYAGVYLEPIGDYSEEQRQVYGEYLHNWNESTSVTSMSVSYPSGGISLSYEEEENVKEWKTDTEKDGDTLLKVKQEEASDDSGSEY